MLIGFLQGRVTDQFSLQYWKTQKVPYVILRLSYLYNYVTCLLLYSKVSIMRPVL